jgi:hypothetical protein
MCNPLVCFGGTLLLFFNTPHGIYMSADSRFTNTPVPQREQAQKIFRAGQAGVCAVSGNLVFNGTTTDDLTGKTTKHHLDVTAVVSSAAEGLSNEPAAAQVHFLADQIYHALQAYWRIAVEQKRLSAPINPTGEPTESSVCTLLFAKREGVQVMLYQVQFSFAEYRHVRGYWVNHLRRPDIIRLDPNLELRAAAQGKTRCAPSVNQPYPVRSRTALVQAINATYAEATSASSECSEAVGGPVDIAVVDERGFHWLQKKGGAAFQAR